MKPKFSSLSIALLCLLAACAKPITQRPAMGGAALESERNTQISALQREQLRRMEQKNKHRLEMETRLHRVFSNVAEAGLTLCQELRPNIGVQACVYNVVLEERGPLNAYADGNSIHITPAMMRFVDSDEELAFILSHELSHNLMGHNDAKRKNALAGALIGALIDGFAAYHGTNTEGAFMNQGAAAGVLSYSKDFEQEADYVGLYAIARAGFDVKQAPDLWRRMSIREPDGIYNSQTHPSNPERFVFMEQTIQEIALKKKHHEPLLPEIEKVDAATASPQTWPTQRIRK